MFELGYFVFLRSIHDASHHAALCSDHAASVTTEVGEQASKIYFSSIFSGTKWSFSGFLIAGPEFLLTGTKFCISEETGAGKLWFFSERKERMFKKLRRFQKTHLQLRKSIFRQGTEKGPIGN